MTFELHAADSGSRLSLRLGESVTVRLPESPTTGYRWVPEYDQSALRLTEDRSGSAESPRGGGADRVLVFEALRPGSATLNLAKRRSWETAEPVETFSVQLEVPDGA